MSKTLRINHPGDGEWIMGQVGGMFHTDCDHVIAVARQGELLGGVVYTGYMGASISMHWAGSEGENWTTRDFFWAAFAYPFLQLDVHKIIGLVPASNTRALVLDLKLGFQLETRIPEVCLDRGDLLILTMTREQCRWLRGHNRCEGVIASLERAA